MSWLQKILGGAPSNPKTELAPRERPLGLDNGKNLVVDPSIARVLADLLAHQPFTGEQRIWSSGVINLGHDNYLQRFYLEDDENWIQVHTTGSVDGQVEAVILFSYSDATVVNTESELARLAGPGSRIGLPKYEFGNHQFERQWGSEEGQAHLVEYTEKVTTPTENYEVKHHAMLYARDTALANRREFLLFSAEEDGTEGAVTLTTSIGVSLYTTDLTVTF